MYGLMSTDSIQQLNCRAFGSYFYRPIRRTTRREMMFFCWVQARKFVCDLSHSLDLDPVLIYNEAEESSVKVLGWSVIPDKRLRNAERSEYSILWFVSLSSRSRAHTSTTQMTGRNVVRAKAFSFSHFNKFSQKQARSRKNGVLSLPLCIQ